MDNKRNSDFDQNKKKQALHAPRTHCDHAQYKHFRNTISKLTRISKKQYYSQFFTINLENIQKTWEGINTLLNRKKKTSMKTNSLKQPNSNTTLNMKSRISNIMNEHFTGIGPTLANNLPTPKNSLLNFLTKKNHLQLHFSFVRYLQTKLNWKFFLCLASDIISDVLTKILNKSIDLGTFPSKLKMAKVIPIFTSDDNTDPNNYRPISLLSYFNRIFEKLVYKRMKSLIEGKNILCTSQYGFRQGHSTEHAILDIVSRIQ